MSNQIKGNEVENIELFFKGFFFFLFNQKKKKQRGKMAVDVIRKK